MRCVIDFLEGKAVSINKRKFKIMGNNSDSVLEWFATYD
jgi:hypothetical protein